MSKDSVDIYYFKKELQILQNNLHNYTANELRR